MQERSKRALIAAAVLGIVVMGFAGWWLGGMGKSKPQPAPEVAAAPEPAPPEPAVAAPEPAPAVADNTPVAPAPVPAPNAGGGGRQGRRNFGGQGGVANGQGFNNLGQNITLGPPPANGEQQVVTINTPNGPVDTPLPPGVQIVQDGQGATTVQLPNNRGGNPMTIQFNRGGGAGGGNGGMAITINGQTITPGNFRGFGRQRGQNNQAQPVPDPAAGQPNPGP